jgi:hypothetical protein
MQPEEKSRYSLDANVAHKFLSDTLTAEMGMGINLNVKESKAGKKMASVIIKYWTHLRYGGHPIRVSGERNHGRDSCLTARRNGVNPHIAIHN